jgi:hypothetical protein
LPTSLEYVFVADCLFTGMVVAPVT